MDKNKIIAQEILKIIGGKPTVTRYWDSAEKKYIDIFCSKDRPRDGVITCATIGLSDTDIRLSSENKRLRIELLGVCYDKIIEFPNILSIAAFEIMDKNRCGYGSVLPRIIELYCPNIEMKNICLISPFLWEEFRTMDIDDIKVTWLLAIPISDEEMYYVQKKGIDELETLFEKTDIDIFDLNRKSVI